jgi:hypothetical protein
VCVELLTEDGKSQTTDSRLPLFTFRACAMSDRVLTLAGLGQ